MPDRIGSCPIDQLALNIADGLYFSDSSGTVRYANQALAVLCGLDNPACLLGKPVSEILGYEIWPKCSLANGDTGNTNDTSQDATVHIQRPDGKELWLEIRPGVHAALPVPIFSSRSSKSTIIEHGQQNPGQTARTEAAPRDTKVIHGQWAVVRDISGYEIKRNMLQGTEAFYKTIVELSPDAITVASLDMHILDVNVKAQSLFGCVDKNSAIGRQLVDFIEPSAIQLLNKQMAEQLSAGIAMNIETTMVRCDGSHFHAEISAKIIQPESYSQPVMIFLSRDITERKQLEQTLRNLAITDPLTRLYNRRGLALASEQELELARQHRYPTAVFFMDIDNMKEINDRHGHEVGDLAIRIVTDSLRNTFKETDIIARWGGDEFVVLVFDPQDDALDSTIEHFNAHLEQQRRILVPQCRLSVTTGLSASFPDSPQDLGQMIERADAMMYLNKRHCKCTPMPD